VNLQAAPAVKPDTAIQRLQFFGRKLKIRGRTIFLHVLNRAGLGNGDDALLCNAPIQCDLGWSFRPALRDPTENLRSSS
jgi:hypothetical protein